MNPLFHDSLSRLEIDLKNIENITPEPLTRFEKSILTTENHFHHLKDTLKNYTFKNTAEEIDYFKNIQPAVVSKIIYFSSMYRHELKKQSLCTVKSQKTLCKKELKNLELYLSENQIIITYYKSNKCNLDEKYFTRNNSEFPFILEESVAFIDKEYTTGYNLLIARFLAYERFSDYINSELHWLNSDLPVPKLPPGGVLGSPLKWTGSKVELAELALFQFWNVNRFENPISIARTDILLLSRLGSTHTYYKCLNDLHNWGYLIYVPSKNPLKASIVNMSIFDTSHAQAELMSCSKNDTSCAQVVHPSLNNTNRLNNKTLYVENPQAQKIENENLFSGKKKKRKKVASKKEMDIIPPLLDQVTGFFATENFPEIEARKFFNHFQSIGWKVGGKAPMKDWKAAARNWMINSNLFTKPGSQPQQKTDPNNKNYSEPL